MEKKPEFGLLSDVRVVLIGLSVAAPFAAQLYAEHGADVIWIENPNAVDSTRNSKAGGTWVQDRRNMRSLNMNYFKEEGKEAFLKIIEKSDVLIEGSVGGRFDKIGLSDEVLWGRNPGLIIAHISGFGQTGDPDYVKRPGYDSIAQAFGCSMRMNGMDGMPSIPAMPFPGDYTPSFYAFGMTLAALHKREKTGKGESFDIAQFETMVRLQANYPSDYLRWGLDYVKEGDHSRIAAGYGTYMCGDGNEVYILFLGPGVMKRGLPVLGLEYGTPICPDGESLIPVNTPAAEEFEKRLRALCQSHTAKEIERIFADVSVPCSTIMSYGDAVENPHYQARGVFTTWPAFDGNGEHPGVKIVPECKNYPGQIWRGAPSAGADNEDILTEMGVDEATIQTLYDKKLLAKVPYTDYGIMRYGKTED